MASIQRTKIDRLYRYAEKKARVTLSGLKGDKIKGRFVGPKVLSNSIPKSGTHLLEVFLESLPTLRNAGHRTYVEDGGGVSEKLKRMRAGAFYNAHLPARTEYKEILRGIGAKCLLMVRDPRAVAVSRMYYVTEIDYLHPAHSYFCGERDRKRRIEMAVTGIPGVMPSLKSVYDLFSGWLEEENTLVVRFEELRGAPGGGDEEAQRKVVMKIVDHLGLYEREIDWDYLLSILNSGKSSTFRKGSVSSWRSDFNENLNRMMVSELGGVAERYGYNMED